MGEELTMVMWSEIAPISPGLEVGPSVSCLLTLSMDFLQTFAQGKCVAVPQKIGAPDSFAFDWRLLVSSLVVVISAAMSASVGVGGGGVYVPLFIAVSCLNAHASIPVSKVCVLGVALTTFIINIPQRHPKANRPLVNYSVAFLMAPTTILGTVFGIMLFIVFPQWFILILLVVVLGITNYRTIVKALELHRSEQASAKSSTAEPSRPINTSEEDGVTVHSATQPLLDEQEMEDLDDPNASLLSHNGSNSREQSNEENYFAGESESEYEHMSAEAKVLLDKESRTPILKIAALVGLWLAMLLLVMVRGGGESTSSVSRFGVVKCSWQFWLLTAVVILILGGGAAVGVWLQWRRTKQLAVAGVPREEGDIVWTPWKYAGFLAVGCFAGMCAGVLGIGSGMINVPYMLEAGMSPQVAAATSSFIIIFTALSTVVQYMIAGVLPLKSGAWYGFLGLLSALVGQFVISKLVKKYKKASIISFMLAVVITTSAIGLVAMAGVEMADAVKKKTPGYWRFNNYCSTKGKPGKTPVAPPTALLTSDSLFAWTL